MANSHRSYGGKKNFPARLQSLCKAWQKMYEGPLKHRQRMLRLWASGFYDTGHSNDHIINLMDRGVSTIVPFLVEGDPKALVETQIPSFRPYAYTTQLALNYMISKLNFAENVLIPVATNSMFGLGVTLTSSTYDRDIGLHDTVIRSGLPTVAVIDDSNYIGDASARHRHEFGFEGDIYKLPTSYAKDFFNGKDKAGNQISDYISADCKLHENYSPEGVSKFNYDRSRLSLTEYTTFIDLYLRDSNTIVTIMPEGKKAKILREREYKGPGDGPYDVLAYKYFPDTPIPLPPAWSWHDADVSTNKLMKKMQEQAESQKNILAFSDAASEDAERIVNAENMQTVRVNDVAALKPISFPGTTNENYQWVAFLQQEFAKQGANPDVLGGRGAQAPTLGQEQLLVHNATRSVNNMYSRFTDFSNSILRKLAWEYWTNPLIEIPVVKEIPGVGNIPEVFSKSEHVGDFYDFAFKIQEYSTQKTNPSIQYQKIMQLMTQWVMPTQEQAAAQGARIDIPLITQKLGQYLGVDSLKEWYKTAVPEGLEQIPPFKAMPKSMQGNDSFGKTLGSENANLNQQQMRTSSDEAKL